MNEEVEEQRTEISINYIEEDDTFLEEEKACVDY